MPILAAWLLSAAPQVAPPDLATAAATDRAAELRAALAALRAGASVERAGAEQRLSITLRASDAELVRSALADGDPEVAARLVNAIGARDEHVELAARLLADADARVRDVGERALRQQIERWLRGAFAEPRRSNRAADALADWRVRFPWRPIAIPARAAEELDLELELDRLVRVAPLPLAVALDPDLALAPHPRARAVEASIGAWDAALDALRRAARFELQTPEAWPEWGEPTRPFIVVLAGSSAAPIAPGERLVGWVGEVASTAPAPRRAAAARALAGSGWPAAVEWLGRRFADRGDAAALDGALLAAGRAGVARALRSPAAVGALLAIVDGTAEAPAGSPFAEVFAASDSAARWQLAARIARALGAGPARLDDGSSRVALLAAGLDAAHARGAFARLVALEQLGGAHPEAAAACARLLQRAGFAQEAGAAPDAQRDARLLRQALRATVALGGAAVEIAHPDALLACATSRGAALELARLLAASAATGVERLGPAAPDAHASFVLFAWELALSRAPQAAARLASTDLAEAGAWARALELERRDGAARKVAAAARERLRADAAAQPDEERIREFEFHAGLLPAELEPQVVARAIQRGELELLARAVAGPSGEAARAALVDRLAARLADERGADESADRRLEGVLAAALRELYAARLDEAAAAFDDAVSERLRESRKHPFAKGLLERGWPRLPALEWVDLELDDRAP